MAEQRPRAKAAPGWYPHPSMADTKRYWDGQAWTDQIAPASRPVLARDSGPSVSKIAGGVALGVLAAVLAVWFVVGVVTADDAADCAIENANRALEGQSALDCD